MDAILALAPPAEPIEVRVHDVLTRCARLCAEGWREDDACAIAAFLCEFAWSWPSDDVDAVRPARLAGRMLLPTEAVLLALLDAARRTLPAHTEPTPADVRALLRPAAVSPLHGAPTGEELAALHAAIVPTDVESVNRAARCVLARVLVAHEFGPSRMTWVAPITTAPEHRALARMLHARWMASSDTGRHEALRGAVFYARCSFAERAHYAMMSSDEKMMGAQSCAMRSGIDEEIAWIVEASHEALVERYPDAMCLLAYASLFAAHTQDDALHRVRRVAGRGGIDDPVSEFTTTYYARWCDWGTRELSAQLACTTRHAAPALPLIVAVGEVFVVRDGPLGVYCTTAAGALAEWEARSVVRGRGMLEHNARIPLIANVAAPSMRDLERPVPDPTTACVDPVEDVYEIAVSNALRANARA